MRTRVLASLVIWFLCLPSMLGFLLLCFGALGGLAKGGEVGSIAMLVFVYVALASGCFAWATLLHMNIAWLRNSKLHWLWPVGGTVAGLVAFVPLFQSVWPMVLASPGIVFAAYLAFWHLRGIYEPATSNAA